MMRGCYALGLGGSPMSIGVHQFVRLFVTRFLAGIVLAVMLTGGATVGTLDDAFAAFKRGDFATAMRLWLPLAQQGEAGAQFGLCNLYYQGRGVPQDYAEATKWCRSAADQGHALAQSFLGTSYGAGRGIPQDYVLAHMWCNLAAAQPTLFQEDIRKLAVECRETAASQMTPAQLAEAQKLARDWKPK